MKIIPVANEAPDEYVARARDAYTFARNYKSLYGFEHELGVPPRPTPKFSLYRSAQHPLFNSPLLGTDSATHLGKLDYFSWQAIQNLPTWGSIVVAPNTRSVPGSTAWFDDGSVAFGNIVSPVPIELPNSLTLAMQAGTGPRRGQIIGTPGHGTHSWTSSPNNWQSDNAVDIKLSISTPIYSIGPGVISTRYGFGDTGQGGRFAGKRLHLEYSNNIAYYAHLSKVVVQPGQRVEAGELLGYSGSANGVPHLHFALKRNDPLWLVTHARRQQPY